MEKILTWFENFILSILSLIKVIILSKPGIRIPHVADDKQLIILGNGPSLTKQISGLDNPQSFDLMSVNNFPATEMFERVKPGIHIMLAPEYFIEGVNDNYIDIRNNLYNALYEKTDWPLILFLPVFAKKYKALFSHVLNNSNIKILYFNATPVEGFDAFMFWLMRRNLGMPRPHNVLIPAILLGLNMKYKSIGLMGADHSWLKNLWVDEGNRVLLIQKHFYDENSAQAKPMLMKGKNERNLHEVLYKFYISFKSYFLLRAYSSKLQSEIINLTRGSYIDAFKRADKLIN